MLPHRGLLCVDAQNLCVRYGHNSCADPEQQFLCASLRLLFAILKLSCCGDRGTCLCMGMLPRVNKLVSSHMLVIYSACPYVPAVSCMRSSNLTRNDLQGLNVPARLPATWDDCLLLLLASPTGASVCGSSSSSSNGRGSSGGSVFTGCCHRGCTNLMGGTDADLRLKKCAGCQLAR